jgi:preprotein translocase subunit SecA
MRLFGQERLMSVFETLGVDEDQPIEHKLLSSAIEKAQKRIETNNYGIRSHLLQFDEVMNEQREIIYAERRKVLDGDNMRSTIMSMITDFVESSVNRCINEDHSSDQWDYQELNQLILPTIPMEPIHKDDSINTKDELIQALKAKAVKMYEAKEAEFPEEAAIREIERVVLLKAVDRRWMDHIDDMDQLKTSIGLVGYGQRDPVIEYKSQGYDMFNEMSEGISEDTVRMMMHIQVEQKVEREQVAKISGTNKDEGPSVKSPMKREKKVYPNDLCPCGSGLKYKNCHGRKA